MYNYQQIEENKNMGSEFMKIFGATLVISFLLMSMIQYRMGATEFDQVTNEVKVEESPAVQPTTPIADAKDFLPLHKLKNIFVNLSF